MGLGILGRGVGDARFLAECGADVLVTDLKDEAELADSVRELQGYENISFVLGKHRKQDFTDTDLVIKAAGVPLDSPYIAAAREAGVEVAMSSALFARFSPATIVGVTGTRGKSTTTHLVAAILQEAGKNVFCGGNVQGVSTLAHLPESTQDEIAVLELDSWQLQGFGELGVSPSVAVFTTFMADHMNYYGHDMERYFADKANIFQYQSADDVLVVSKQVAGYIKQYGYHVPAQTVSVAADELPDGIEIPLAGEHNRLNTVLAIKAVAPFDVPREVTKNAIEAFSGVPGRLERRGVYQGREVYNDTTATTPDALVVALEAFGGRTAKPILIAGGADKQLDVSGVPDAIEQYASAVILLAGTGTDRIRNDLKGRSVPVYEAEDMTEAVMSAFDISKEGDTILLSPGFASFGLFQNEYDRGEQFNQTVERFQ